MRVGVDTGQLKQIKMRYLHDIGSSWEGEGEMAQEIWP